MEINPVHNHPIYIYIYITTRARLLRREITREMCHYIYVCVLYICCLSRNSPPPHTHTHTLMYTTVLNLNTKCQYIYIYIYLLVDIIHSCNLILYIICLHLFQVWKKVCSHFWLALKLIHYFTGLFLHTTKNIYWRYSHTPLFSYIVGVACNAFCRYS